jgi:S1-C subfamily serine protease
MNPSPTTPKTLLTAVTVLVLSLATAGAVRGDDAALYHKTLKATAWITTPGSHGTGWVVDREQRLIVTARHVVEDHTDVEVRFPLYQEGQLVTQASTYLGTAAIKGKVIYRDELRDLALIQLESLPEYVVALKLAAGSATPDTRVLAVGNSDPEAGPSLADLNLWKVRTGEVRAKEFRVVRLSNGQNVQASVINTSLNSRMGDSGGPVVNLAGELVAVTSYGSSVDAYAIDVTEVRTFLARALAAGRNVADATEPTGTWTLSSTDRDGRTVYASLTLRADGTCLWEADRAFEGTYTYTDGRLTLTLPGMPMWSTAKVIWDADDAFRFTTQGTEYTAERR